MWFSALQKWRYWKKFFFGFANWKSPYVSMMMQCLYGTFCNSNATSFDQVLCCDGKQPILWNAWTVNTEQSSVRDAFETKNIGHVNAGVNIIMQFHTERFHMVHQFQMILNNQHMETKYYYLNRPRVHKFT